MKLFIFRAHVNIDIYHREYLSTNSDKVDKCLLKNGHDNKNDASANFALRRIAEPLGTISSLY